MQPHLPPRLTVTQLTQQLQRTLEERFHQVWVEGELSGFKPHQSGHFYFTLKDQDARVDCVVWRTAVPTVGYYANEGDRVVALGTIRVHPPRGGYQLVIDRLLSAGAGQLQAAFEETKKRLATDGLFSPQRKRKLPFLPKKIGVVTSPTGAALRDIQAVLHRRAPQIPIVLYPAMVQGRDAALEIAQGIARLAQAPGVEVIIVGRGGGSQEDLWVFNDERLARAIAASPIPVVSAVGHEVDLTIADMVADLRAPTPSAAAEAVAPVRDHLLATLANLVERLTHVTARYLQRARERLASSRQRLSSVSVLGPRRMALNVCAQALYSALAQRRDRPRLALLERRLSAASPTRRLTDGRLAHERLKQRLLTSLNERTDLARGRLQTLEARLLAIAVERRLDLAQARLNEAQLKLDSAISRALSQTRGQLASNAARLDALSPLAVLGRGYALVRHGGAVVRRANQVNPGDSLEILLSSGQLSAQVVEDKSTRRAKV